MKTDSLYSIHHRSSSDSPCSWSFIPINMVTSYEPSLEAWWFHLPWLFNGLWLRTSDSLNELKLHSDKTQFIWLDNRVQLT